MVISCVVAASWRFQPRMGTVEATRGPIASKKQRCSTTKFIPFAKWDEMGQWMTIRSALLLGQGGVWKSTTSASDFSAQRESGNVLRCSRVFRSHVEWRTCPKKANFSCSTCTSTEPNRSPLHGFCRHRPWQVVTSVPSIGCKQTLSSPNRSGFV